jgi:hypothetical protein
MESFRVLYKELKPLNISDRDIEIFFHSNTGQLTNKVIADKFSLSPARIRQVAVVVGRKKRERDIAVGEWVADLSEEAISALKDNGIGGHSQLINILNRNPLSGLGHGIDILKYIEIHAWAHKSSKVEWIDGLTVRAIGILKNNGLYGEVACAAEFLIENHTFNCLPDCGPKTNNELMSAIISSYVNHTIPN